MRPIERNRPLKACPDLSCRRLKICHGETKNSACLRTHFGSHDDWCDYMAAKINRISRGAKVDPDDMRSDDEALAEMYKIFQERERELDAMEGQKA